MAQEVIMPKLSMTMTEGTITKWLKVLGDPIVKDEPLLTVLTDKIEIDVEAPCAGIVRGIIHPQGSVVPVGSRVAVIVAPGEQWQEPPALAALAAAVAAAVAPAPAPAVVVRRAPVAPVAVEPVAAAALADGPVRATPAARRIAREFGIPLAEVVGTGAHGRVHRDDVLATLAARPVGGAPTVAPTIAVASAPAAASGAAPAVAPAASVPAPAAGTGSGGAYTEAPLSGLRQVIGQRMTQSVQQAPHVTLHRPVDFTHARDALARLKGKTAVKVTLTHLIALATIRALQQHPGVNATLEGGLLRQYHGVHLGMAVDTPKGLLVPVLAEAQTLSLGGIAQRLADRAERARQGGLTPAELNGASFTISNLGMFGVEQFTPIINPPQVAILGVGAAREQVWAVQGQAVVRFVGTLSLSFDHRALDGADAGRFLAEVVGLLEEPLLLL